MSRQQIIKTMGACLFGSVGGYNACLFQNKRQPLLKWHKGEENSSVGDWGKMFAYSANNTAIAERVLHGHKNLDFISGLLIKAHECDSSSPEIAINLASAFLSQGDIKVSQGELVTAHELFEDAEELFESNQTNLATGEQISMFIARGYRSQQLSRLETSSEKSRELLQKSILSYHHAFELDPKNKVAACLLGEAYVDDKNFQKGVDCFLNAIAIDENYGLAHFRLGQAYVYAVQIEEAKKSFVRALTIHDQNPKPFPKEYQGDKDSLLNDIPKFEGREDFLVETASRGISCAFR